MLTSEGIIQILFIIVIVSLVSYAVIKFTEISSVKAMLLGIGIIVFTDCVLKGMIKYGIDLVFSIIGFSIVIGGFLCRESDNNSDNKIDKS